MATNKALSIFIVVLLSVFLSGCDQDVLEGTNKSVSDTFESGNIGEVVKVSFNKWSLTIADDNNNPELPDAWRCWWYVKMKDLDIENQTEITIKNSGWPYYYLPVYSYDQKEWFHFYEDEVTQNENDEIVITKYFDYETVWIARFYPYTLTDLENYIETLKRSSKVDVQVPGYTRRGKPIYLFKVTDPNVPVAGKKRVFIHARTHSAETPPSFLIEGMINYLLCGSRAANEILAGFEFYIFPMQNVEGVTAGNYRSTPRSENLEVMWYFDSANPLNLTEATPPEVKVMQQYASDLMTDGGPPISIALNLHASNSEPDIRPFFYPHFGPASNGYSPEETSLWNKQLSFIDCVAKNYGYDMIEPITGDGGNSFATKTYPESWWWVNFKDKVMAMTFEMTYGRAGYSPEWVTPDDLRELGVALTYGIRDYYYVPANSDQTKLKASRKIRTRDLKYPELYPPAAVDEMKE